MKYIEKKYLLFFILIFFGLKVTAEQGIQQFGSGSVTLPSQNITIDVEIAKTEAQRSKGLMFRKQLAEHKGMIFIFEENGIQRVWMKNTLIPLDVIFISEQGRIVSINQSLLPCIKKYCDIYHSTGNAKYMLEVNSGMVEKNKIKVGQQLLLTL